jgi:hypothetical protein
MNGPVRLRTVILVPVLLLTLAPVAALAQQAGRVIPARFGAAHLDLPGVTMVPVGTFGGGLEVLEHRRPEIAPLASRFRMQRRTGLVFGLLALAGGAVVFDRFSDPTAGPLELGDPEANILLGSLGAMAVSAVQLDASGRTLRAIAAGFREDGSFRLGIP